ncbi:hypothetical protein EON63_19680 [archaeon]|nr:MAG: hypothetical protein EON63_19680 [archaeon]
MCDRYAYSGVAYSSAKGLDLKWCMTCDQGLPAPDCIFFLDIPVQDAVNVCLCPTLYMYSYHILYGFFVIMLVVVHVLMNVINMKYICMIKAVHTHTHIHSYI